MNPWIADRAHARGDAVALRFGETTWTWAALAGEAVAVAGMLQGLDVARGDVVAVRMPAGPRFVALLHAAQLLGAALLPLNTRFTEEELARVVAHNSPRLVLDATESTTRWWGNRRREDALEAARARKSFAPPRTIDPAAALTIVLTSGSTGTPKAVVLTNANHEASAAGSRARLGHGERDVWLATLPLFHVGGLAILSRAALEGSVVVLEPAFDAGKAVDALEGKSAAAVTMVSLVPTMLSRVLDRMKNAAAPQLRCVLVGGAPLSPALGRRALDARLPVSATYGMTEACSQIASSIPGSEDAARGLSGRPLDGVEVRIADPDADGWGEILVRGPNVMRGYSDGDRSRFTDGWLHTRDRGRLADAGALAVAGRIDDVVITGGENVSPVEVEHCLDSHPAVAESLVYGVDDEEWGQRLVALVVPRDDASLAHEELQAWCRDRIAAYKVPRELRFVRELPRSAAGKVLRPGRVTPA